MPRTTIRSEDITDLQVKTADMATGEVTTAKMAVDPTNASNLSSGSVPLAQLGNAPATDLTGLQNDIATLALHSATQNNQTAYNLTNAFVDQYEDSTGIDTTSTVQRNTSGEYMSSIYTNTPDANTLVLLHMDGANAGTTFTDSSPVPLTINVNNTTTTTAEKKFGTASADATVTGSYLRFGASSLDFAANASFTFDAWYKIPSAGATMNNRFFQKGANHANGYGLFMDGTNIYFGYNDANVVGFARNLVVGTGNWHHIAIVRNTAAMAIYLDGVSKDTATSGTAANHNADTYLFANPSSAGSDDRWNGYCDEFRISNVARWTSGFTPETSAYGSVINATGNYTSTTETALATVSKMSIVVLYENAYGTATLNTDLVAEVSSNGGTNWTTAPLTAAGTFSTGILSAKSDDITISNTGTAPKYRISFANQAGSTKETRVKGVAIQY
jgi:hypothetical protein